MSSNAWTGALMGLGRGLTQFGGLLATEHMREKANERLFDRQKSLEEIRQRYQDDRIENERRYKEGREAASLVEGTPEYNLRMAELEDQERLATHRAGAYGYGKGSGILSKYDQSKFTEKSWGPFIEEVNRLMAENPKMTDMDAARLASEKFPLERIPESTKGTDQTNQRTANEEAVMMFEEKGREQIIAELVAAGVGSQAELEQMSDIQLKGVLKWLIFEIMNKRPGEEEPANPLMGGMPGMGATGDVLGIGLE